MSTVALGALLAPLNSTMLAVALPEIRTDFGLSHASVGWLVSTYLIAMAVVQPAAGRLGDEIGRLRVFRAALLAFLVFSLAAVFAPTFELLVAFRTLQAVSGAILIPNGIGMLRAAVPAARFGTYSGINSAVIGATAAAGPLVGAGILAFAPWRALFLVNIPVVAAASVMASRLPSAQETTESRRMSLPGLALFAALLVVLTWTLNSLRSGSASGQLAGLVLLAVVAAVFIAHQRNASVPVAAWSLFRNRGFVGASSHILLMNLVMYTTLLAVPFFITDVQHRSATVAGLLLGAMAALQSLSAPFAGRISDSVGRRLPTLISSSLATFAAILLLAGVGKHESFWFLGIAVTILGLGVGIGFVTSSAAAVESVPGALSGTASGTQSMMRYAGSILGTGILTGLLATGEDADPSIATFRILFLVVASIAAISFAAAAMVRPFAAHR
ncbi:MAG: MFS transporter [Dehalococcoidia bacterium]